MSKRTALPYYKRHIPIYQEDWDFLLLRFGPDSPSKLGAGVSIREIVHRRVQFLRHQENLALDQLEESDAQKESENA